MQHSRQSIYHHHHLAAKQATTIFLSIHCDLGQYLYALDIFKFHFDTLRKGKIRCS